MYRLDSIKVRTIFQLCLLLTVLVACDDGEAIENIEFTSEPEERVFHNDVYNYVFQAQNDNGDVGYSVDIPDWMTYDASNNTITGKPGFDYVNESFVFSITAHGENNSLIQEVTVKVLLGSIHCDEQFNDPEVSDYVLPFEVGGSYRVQQATCNGRWGDQFYYLFAMPYETEIMAARGGEVIYKVSAQDVQGECALSLVRVQHEDGSIMEYSNFSKVLDAEGNRVPGTGIEIEVGQTIQAGDLVGYSGRSCWGYEYGIFMSLHHEKSNFQKEYSMPLNFKNAAGSLADNNSLKIDELYEALPYN